MMRALARARCWLRRRHDPELCARIVIEGQLVQVYSCRDCRAVIGG